jgi:YidC/Oxa1 family membrane protein insertase
VRDLARPDTLFLIPGVGFPFNLLPLIMGGTMLWQAHLTPPSPGMDPAQAKMMRYMPLMFMVFLYNFSAGLTLYWTVQNLLSIVQTKLTRTRPEPVAPVKGPVLTPPQKKKK